MKSRIITVLKITNMLYKKSRSSDLPVSFDDVFESAYFFESQWSPCVELLGGDPHLATLSEFTAVGEAGGRVDVYGCGIHQGGEELRRFFILCNDAIGVTCRMRIDVRDGFINIVDHFDAHDVIQEFRVKIFRAC